MAEGGNTTFTRSAQLRVKRDSSKKGHRTPRAAAMASPPAADAPPLAASPTATTLPDPCVPSAATPMASVSINNQMVLGGLARYKKCGRNFLNLIWTMPALGRLSMPCTNLHTQREGGFL